MSDPFDSPADLFAWAQTHFVRIKRLASDYISREPYTKVIERNPNTGGCAHKIRLTKPIPRDIQMLTFDTINALRASLDHSIYASCVALGNVVEPKNTKFPFGNDEEGARRDATGRKGPNPTDPAIIGTALSFKPYKGGNNILSGLNELRNMKHHRVLAPVGVATVGTISIDGATMTGLSDTGYGIALCNDWDSAKGEYTFLKTGSVNEDYNLKVTISITFSETTPFPNGDAIGVLYALFSETHRVLVAIKAETDRLKRQRGL